MKNILIGLFVIIFFTACVQKYEICENPRMTGELIVKDSYSDQDSVRISTKNIRINNKTITEFKKLGQFNPFDFFAFNLYNANNYNYLYPQYVSNDTSINFKIPTGQYKLDYYDIFNFGEIRCNNYGSGSITYTINVLDTTSLSKSKILN